MGMSEPQNLLPQASRALTPNLATDSDRVKAPIVGAGSMDFGGSQAHKSVWEENRRVKFLELGKKIGDLLHFVLPRNNVHGEIKRMVSSIRADFDEMVDMEESLSVISSKTVEAETQTSPQTWGVDPNTDGYGGPSTAAAELQPAGNNVIGPKTVEARTRTLPLTSGVGRNSDDRGRSSVAAAELRTAVNDVICLRTVEVETQASPQTSDIGPNADDCGGPSTAAAELRTAVGGGRTSSWKVRPLKSTGVAEKKLSESVQGRNIQHAEVPQALHKPSDETPYQNHEMDWHVVGRKRPRPPKPHSYRPECVIVKANDGGPSYADILRQIKGDPSLKDAGENVAKVRRNAAGYLLLELRKSAAASEISEAISRKLGELARVTTRRDEMTLEIRDLDELTTAAEVCEAVSGELKSPVELASVISVRRAYRGTQTAVVRLPTELARRALKSGRVRIGWVNCRVREKVIVRKCYRCWAFGHLARDCQGTDRSKSCHRCGEDGHLRQACKSPEARCVLCKDKRNHPTGSFTCPAYQVAMKAMDNRK